MNGKLWTILLIIFIIFTVAGAIIDSTGGMNITRLNGALSAAATVVPVDSTNGFNSSDYIQIDNEYIRYTWKDATNFGRVADPCTRAYAPPGRTASAASVHANDAKVLSPDSTIIESALGFNILSLTTSSGQLDMPTFFWKAVTVTIPKLILADFSIYSTGILVYVRYIHQLISLGVFIPLAIQLILAGISAITNFFRLV